MNLFIRTVVLLMTIGCVYSTVSAQLIIGHRGASYDAPENTLSAFGLAIVQAADGFEADFYLTSDGQIVCFHDKDTKRIGGKKFVVEETAFEDLRALDVGRWKGLEWKGERIPTIDEVLAALPAEKKVFIELKSGLAIIAPLVAAIKAATSLSPEQIVIISFHEEVIVECKRRLPDIKAHWLCRFKRKEDGTYIPPTLDEVIAVLRRSNADGLGAEAIPDYVDATFIRGLKEAGFEFHVWTIDDPEIARFYQELGALGITTNRPKYIREKLSQNSVK